jgi:energy-coupling factor transport system permease protein
MRLAAGMDARGYGRTGSATRGSRRLTASLLVLGMVGLCAGVYGLLDGTAPRLLGVPTIALGALLCCLGLAVGGRRVQRTAYRPDPWLWPEWVVSGGGVCCAALMFVSLGYSAADLNPSLTPLAWPTLPLLPVLGILVAGAAALAAPMPPRNRVVPRSLPAADRERVPA